MASQDSKWARKGSQHSPSHIAKKNDQPRLNPLLVAALHEQGGRDAASRKQPCQELSKEAARTPLKTSPDTVASLRHKYPYRLEQDVAAVLSFIDELTEGHELHAKRLKNLELYLQRLESSSLLSDLVTIFKQMQEIHQRFEKALDNEIELREQVFVSIEKRLDRLESLTDQWLESTESLQEKAKPEQAEALVSDLENRLEQIEKVLAQHLKRLSGSNGKKKETRAAPVKIEERLQKLETIVADILQS